MEQNLTFIDTHCHLDSTDFDEDLDSVISNAKSLGVGTIIIPGANIDDLPKASKIAHKYDGVYFAAGVHPYEVDGYDIDTLRSYIDDAKCVAIGECGLDYYRLPESNVEEYKNRQKEVFISQIELAVKHDLPLIVHIRDASSDSLEILSRYPTLKGVLHCYNADTQLLKLSDRFYYGIGGVATFKNARKLVEALPKIPQNRIILETDAPYLAPTPHRGERNSPEYIPNIAQRVTEILQIDINHLATLSTTNAKNLFRDIS